MPATLPRPADRSTEPQTPSEEVGIGGRELWLSRALPRPRGLIAAILLLSAGLVLVFTPGTTITNSRSRLATIESLVHRGTFDVSASSFQSVDRVVIDGRMLSSKPPVQAVIGAAFYATWYALTGIPLHPARPAAVMFVSYVFGLLPFVVLLVAFVRMLVLFDLHGAPALVASAALGAGSLLTGYATTLTNHVPAAALCMLSFASAVQIRRRTPQSMWPWIVTGFLAGLAPTFDLAASVISAAIGIYLLCVDARRACVWFAIGAVVPLGLHFVLTYVATGSVLPLYLRPEVYDPAYWSNPFPINLMHEPKWIYVANIVLGERGMLAMTPLLVLGAAALIAELRRPESRPEAVVVAASTAIIALTYVVITSDYGGYGFGFRWLLLLHPFLLLYAGVWVARRRLRGAGWSMVVLLLAIGQLHAAEALAGPWRISTWERLVASVRTPWRFQTHPLHADVLAAASLSIAEDSFGVVACRPPKPGGRDHLCGPSHGNAFVGLRNVVVAGQLRPCLHFDPARSAVRMDLRVPADRLASSSEVEVALPDRAGPDRGRVLEVGVRNDGDGRVVAELSERSPSARLDVARLRAGETLTFFVVSREGSDHEVCITLER